MSHFVKDATHPETGKVEQAVWLDDYFGRHRYGVQFSDGQIFREDEVRECEDDARE